MPLGGALAAGGIVGGIISADQKRSGATAAGDAQKAALNAMIAKLDSVGLPPDQSAALILDQYKQAGILTPQLEQQVRDSTSAYQGIKTGGVTRDMQVKALQQMSQYGQAGLTPDERAAMAKSRQAVQGDLQANQQSIIQNMAARGQGGQGAELAARLAASQGSANQASSQADDISTLAAQRALQAIGQSSNMAGQLNAQDFGQQSAIASAQDQMNRFNVQNQMAINQRNTSSANQAQAGNLANAQSISNANVGQTNQEKYDQLARQRQFWNEKLQYAQSYGQPLEKYGNASANQAKNEQDIRSQGISSAVGAGVSALGGAFGMPSSPSPGVQNAGQGPTNENANKNLINGY